MLPDGFADGGSSHGTRNGGGLEVREEAGQQLLPQGLQEGHGPASPPRLPASRTGG